MKLDRYHLTLADRQGLARLRCARVARGLTPQSRRLQQSSAAHRPIRLGGLDQRQFKGQVFTRQRMIAINDHPLIFDV